MTAPAAPTRAGSVGAVETRYLDLPNPVPLDCGRELHPVRVAYETYGVLNAAKSNAIALRDSIAIPPTSTSA